ncbi:MAG TPA: hypothetical protein VMU07_00425 [Candidatus Paceibacterota bacterium]|nr:hypothetical protein [Candidatus Paceibacterota bacterium]
MRLTTTFLWKERDAARRYRAAVSLHAHTNHSQEKMIFFPPLMRCCKLGRVLLQAIESRHRKNRNEDVNYSSAWWRPPLSPREVYDSEQKQISAMGVGRAYVSITDHDQVSACRKLCVGIPLLDVPISEEWTVPFGDGPSPAKFHLGIHNLPADRAVEWHKALSAYTQRPSRKKLRFLLEVLSSCKGVLVVLNHPFSDEGHIGRRMHEATLLEFLSFCGPLIHALELNGMQRWGSNVRVGHLAREYGYPVVSGGDRHGLEPNSILNLTNAESFEAFVHEIRVAKRSNILFMPQCKRNYAVRMMRNIHDVIGAHRGRRWKDRVFYRFSDGTVLSLAKIWKDAGHVIFGIDMAVTFFAALATPLGRFILHLGLPHTRDHDVAEMREAVQRDGELVPENSLQHKPIVPMEPVNEVVV